jgi:hypothetical protein
MIVDVALPALTVNYGPAHELAELFVAHDRVRAERYEVIKGSHARTKVRFDQLKHQLHGHSASAVRNDDEHTLAINGKSAQPILNDAIDFLSAQDTIRRSFSH